MSEDAHEIGPNDYMDTEKFGHYLESLRGWYQAHGIDDVDLDEVMQHIDLTFKPTEEQMAYKTVKEPELPHIPTTEEIIAEIDTQLHELSKNLERDLGVVEKKRLEKEWDDLLDRRSLLKSGLD